MFGEYIHTLKEDYKVNKSDSKYISLLFPDTEESDDEEIEPEPDIQILHRKFMMETAIIVAIAFLTLGPLAIVFNKTGGVTRSLLQALFIGVAAGLFSRFCAKRCLTKQLTLING